MTENAETQPSPLQAAIELRRRLVADIVSVNRVLRNTIHIEGANDAADMLISKGWVTAEPETRPSEESEQAQPCVVKTPEEAHAAPDGLYVDRTGDEWVKRGGKWYAIATAGPSMWLPVTPKP